MNAASARNRGCEAASRLLCPGRQCRSDYRQVTGCIRQALDSHEGRCLDRSDLAVCMWFRLALRRSVGISGCFDTSQRAAARIAIADAAGTISVAGCTIACH